MQVKRLGWRVSIARTREEILSLQPGPPAPRSRISRVPSKRVGSANRRTSNLRKSSASTTSKDDHGRGCIVTLS